VILACWFSCHIVCGSAFHAEIDVPSVVTSLCEEVYSDGHTISRCRANGQVAGRGHLDVLVPITYSTLSKMVLKYNIFLINNLTEESASPVSVSVTSGMTLSSHRQAMDMSIPLKRTLFCVASPGHDPILISTTPSAPAELRVSVKLVSALKEPLILRMRTMPKLYIVSVSKELASSGEVRLMWDAMPQKDGSYGRGEVRVFAFRPEPNQACFNFDAPHGCVNTEQLISCLEQNPLLTNTHSLQFTVANKSTLTLSRYTTPKLTEGKWFLLFDPMRGAHRKYKVTLDGAGHGSALHAFPFLLLPCITVFCLEFLHQFVRILWHAHQNSESKKQKLKESVAQLTQFYKDARSWTLWEFAKGRADIAVNSASYSAQVFVASVAFFAAASQVSMLMWGHMVVWGTKDWCYYNYECYVPFGVDMPVNNMLSHVPYFSVGGLLVIIMFYWEYSMRDRNVDLRIFYALSFSIFLEGLGSMLYHMCPKAEVFQFDSAMMFVIVILSTLALHEEKEAQAVVSSNGVIMFFVLPMWLMSFVGTWFDYVVPVSAGRDGVDPRLFFQLFTVGWTGCTIYSFKNLVRHYTFNPSILSCCRPCCLVFLRLLVAAWMLFVAFDRDFRRGVGGTSNALLVISVLVMICVVLREMWIRQVVRSDCGVVDFVLKSWFFFTFLFFTYVALQFFNANVTDVEITPAESRDINAPCIAANYFDNHDVWHATSALALGLWVLVLLEIRMARKKVPGFTPGALEMERTSENCTGNDIS